MMPDTEAVEYDIILQAAQAMQNLQNLTSQAETFNQKVAMVTKSLKEFSASTGLSMKATVSLFKDADNAFAALNNKSALFGDLQKQGWEEVEKGTGRAVRGVDALRIALGVLVSMLIFSVIQAFQQMVSMAVKGLVEIEAAMFNIVNAEKKLSEQGIEITVEGLQQLIKDLQVLNPMLSEFQATELISVISTKVAPALGLGQTEIERLSKSIAVLAVRNQALGKSFEEVEQQVVTGLLSGKVTAGINQLGVKITDQIVREEALRLGLVATAEAYDNLNAKEQERINALSIISILEQNTAQEAESLPAFLQSASGLIGVAKAELQDLLTGLGQTFAPLIKTIFRGIIGFLERMNQSLETNKAGWRGLVTALDIVAKFTFKLFELVERLSMAYGRLVSKISELVQKIPALANLVKALFPEQEYEDTPTANIINPEQIADDGEKAAEEAQKAEDKINDIMKEAREKRLDLERDYQNKLEDINRDYSNKLADIARDTEQKKEDALRDYNQKVSDINNDTSQKIQEAQEEARRKELDREKEFQQKLKELREKFLFDLEDALHERDARQILRLIRQYNRDKNNLQERHELERKEAEQTLQIRVQELEQERQLKLQAARREYEEKLVEIGIGERRALEEAAIWKRRQLEDARIWYQRQLQEQRTYLQRKLQDVATALSRELQMNSSAAQAMIGLWSNAFASMLSGYNATLAGLVAPNIGSGGAIVGGSYVDAAAGWQAQANTFANSGMYGTGPAFAEGGTLLATRPMTATFGEVPEIVSFTPLQGGNNVGKLFGDKSALDGGATEILLTLSPDLEARIVNRSMDEAANVVLKINRSKV